MVRTHISGFPRIGAQRELKFALESFWQGKSSEQHLRHTAAQLRERHWQLQAEAGLDWVCVGDFALYDHVLATLELIGGLPRRFGFANQTPSLKEVFRCARGGASQSADHSCAGHDDAHAAQADQPAGAFAMEMTKWFDTNYHYLVPEYTPGMRFALANPWLIKHVREARALGHAVKPVLLGPISLLWLGKEKGGLADRLSLLDALLPAYIEVLQALRDEGCEWLQIDEPALALDLPPAWQAAFERCYQQLPAHGPRILLATCFDDVSHYAPLAASLPVAGWHIDLQRAPAQLEAWCTALAGTDKVLSCGVVDGRNIWRCDVDAALTQLEHAQARLPGRVWIASSCSLLHVPVSLAQESRLSPALLGGLAFAVEKLHEISLLGRALQEGSGAVQNELDFARSERSRRLEVTGNQRAAVRQRVKNLRAEDAKRQQPFTQRASVQRAALRLPLLPTTSIGSFPQTADIRLCRARFKRGEIGYLGYLQAMRGEIERVIRKQEALDIDVLVHGEPERNDMVEYFGEQLAGFAFTQFGWVQSYGSRCVKPPIIHADVLRHEAMTVSWASYAQSLTPRPVKGMLTGPITLLQWSFVRDDLPRAAVALQLALAIRDEVADLERAGIRIIQIDEPALREGLPLKRSQWEAYLSWAVRAFRVASAVVRDETQIHTHMCYAEFQDILPAISAMDADVITIETSRSDMELLDAFGDFDYPNDIGPGVYDIHSPRVPHIAEMRRLLEKAMRVIPVERLWINPDCGLKTRAWPEVDAALENMQAVARALRAELALQQAS